MPKLSELQGDVSVGNDVVNLPMNNPEPDSGFTSGLLGSGFAGEIPQMVGSLASLPLKTTPLGMAVSGVGGATGEAFKQIGQHMTGSELAPQTSSDAAGRIGRAFLEEAAFEGVGRGVASMFGRIGSSIKPEMKEGFEEFEKSFEKFGGKLSATQRIEHKNLASWSLLTLDGLSRGSITAKGIYKNFDQMNEAALRNMADNLVEEISETATKNLSDRQIGRIFIDSVDSGKAAHSAASAVNYQAVDNIAKNNGVSVDTGKLKTAAAIWKDKFTKIGNVGKGEIASTEIDKVLKVGKEIGFEDAHFLRSSLLGTQRTLDAAGETGVSTKIMADLIEATTKIMDDAGNSSGIQDAYAKASKFHKFGASSFNDKFIVKLMQKNPERIGETIFRSGNVEEITKARHALKRASLMSNDVNFRSTWNQVQEGYMSGLLSGPLIDTSGAPIGTKILKMFDDKKKLRTMKQALSGEQLKSLKEFGTLAEAVQTKPEAGLGMLMQLSQGGAIFTIASGVMPEATAIPVFLGPPVMAKLLLNPKTSGDFIKTLTTPITSSKSTTLMTKILGAGVLSESDKDKIDRDTQIMNGGLDGAN